MRDDSKINGMFDIRAWKKLLAYSVPAILCLIIPALYNISDRLFLGDIQGISAFAGLSLTLPFLVMFTSVGSVAATGASVLLSKINIYTEREKAEKILSQAFVITVAYSLLIEVVLYFFMEEFLFLFGGRKETTVHAAQYLRILIPSLVFFNILIGFGNCMRICGGARKVIPILLSGLFLNLIINTVLSYTGKLTVENCAYTTFLSVVLTSIPVLLYFTGNKITPIFKISFFKVDIPTIFRIVKAGMTSFFMNMTICTVSVIMNNYLVIRGGSLAIAAYGIISSFTMPLLMCVAGMCQGMQYFFSNRVYTDRVKILKMTFISSIIFTGSAVFASVAMPKFIAELFTDSTVLASLSVEGMQYVFLTLPLVGFQLLIAAFLQSGQRTIFALFINMSRQFIFLIPILFIFSRWWGVTGIWIAVPTADILSMIVALIFSRFGKEKFYNLPELSAVQTENVQI